MADLVGGQIRVMFATMPTLISNVQAGKIKLLAVVENKRYVRMPEVPTLAEAAAPGFDPPMSRLGFFGPAGLPRPILDRLNAEIVGALKAPDVRAKLESVGLEAIGSMSEEFAALVRKDVETFRKIVTAAGIKPE